ncbi:GTPase Era [Flavobacteriaceae bacterium]|jgi:GTP-binding protein Era|nr:GTPase Era [Flavobacteriaceae bacterium]MDA9885943.1 GTPase Era [Flavobacteriaceae bacterium]MDB2673009.1 GTPase Era [Flavobacteriaceae bacterium]MDB4186384.1 GTPase Era [Flavobacteriaceae bacterium]MDB9823682.1 GTPase Era [Flavobacteriaceae bacterium]
MSNTHKAGFVSIVGNPNVGKSTLMNAWVGERLSIITPKAQTTRHRILGILNADDYQLVLSDTPGVITPSYEMQSSMMDFVKTALEDADILIYMLEVGETEMKDQRLFEKILRLEIPVLVLINKIDTTDQESLIKSVAHWQGKFPKANIFPISAITGFSVKEVLNHIIELLPVSPPYYPKDQMTDKPERFFVNEAIREQILQHYDKEVPYAVEVVTEEFFESEKIIKIRSLIMVERETQKGIIIGHKGGALKKVGVGARMKLQAFFTKKIHLELYVKVNKDWRSNERQLKRFGYKL